MADWSEIQGKKLQIGVGGTLVTTYNDTEYPEMLHVNTDGTIVMNGEVVATQGATDISGGSTEENIYVTLRTPSGVRVLNNGAGGLKLPVPLYKDLSTYTFSAATTTTAGVMTAADKTELTNATTNVAALQTSVETISTSISTLNTTLTKRIAAEATARNESDAEIVKRILGTSTNSVGNTDPFIQLGYFSDYDKVEDKLSNMEFTEAATGEFRLHVSGVWLHGWNFITNYSGKNGIQVLAGCVNSPDGELTFSKEFHVLWRDVTGAVCGRWANVHADLLKNVDDLKSMVTAITSASLNNQSRIASLEKHVGVPCEIGSNYETLSDESYTTLDGVILQCKRITSVIKTLVDALNTNGIIKRS